MLLLFTGSIDGTSDRIVSELGDSVFRLNYDLYADYDLAITPSGWSLSSPSGREITSKTATSAFWWKAFSYILQDDRMVKGEVKYIFRELYAWFQLRGLSKGNSPDFHNRFGKLNILSAAQKYFDIAPTLTSIGPIDGRFFDGAPVVVKSLSSESSDDHRVLMTTEVDVERLSPKYPWHIQAKIESNWDITVFQCDGNFYAFERSRHGLKGMDWRNEQKFDYSEQEWFPFDLSLAEVVSLKELARELGVEIGRYDFMRRSSDEKLIFLEFNATGQWVFLDIKNEYGLLKDVTKWLKRGNGTPAC